MYQHISNILSGLYSLGGKYDVAVLEEMVHFSNQFQDFSYQGIPDVRVIVYQGFPALSMMRLATKESGGRANLHQGRWASVSTSEPGMRWRRFPMTGRSVIIPIPAPT